MQLAGAGSYAGCISLPTRYTHTPVETIDINDMEACVDLLIAFIEKGAE
jgi:endoglucanase